VANKIYLQEFQNRKQLEKDKFAQRLESMQMPNFGEYTEDFSPENLQMRQRLGNVFTQLELNNAEARRELRDVLEH